MKHNPLIENKKIFMLIRKIKISALATVVLGFIILLTTHDVTKAQDTSKKNGIGLIAGEPTGITYKHWLSQNSAFDVSLAWSVSSDDNVSINSDYLLHTPKSVNIDTKSDSFSLPFYYGIGARLRLGDDDAQFGIRVPLGLAFYVNNQPIEIFGEIVPIVDVAPDTEFDLNGGIGARFYF